MPKASILVRTKNEERTLGLVLARIFEQDFEDFEVIVLDSGSTDSTLDIARKYPAKVIEMPPTEFTYGRALNAGFAAGSSPLLVSISAHAVPFDRDWLKNLIEPFGDDSVCGVVGKPLPHPDCNPFDRRGLYRRFGTEKIYLHRDSDITFSNANSAIRRADWENLPFDEKLPYSEDLKWSLEMMKRGRRIVYQPTAAAYHSHNENPDQLFDRFYNESRARIEIGVGEERYRASSLIWDILAGTVFDMLTVIKNREPIRWFFSAASRRTAINFGRYCGSRGLPRNTGLRPLTQVFLRQILRVLEQANASLQKLAPLMVRMTRKHFEAIHPKHLLKDNESHYWYGSLLRETHRVLDLGCSQGMHTLFAAKIASEAVGVDQDRQALYVAEFNAKWEGRKNVSFLISSLESPLPLRDNSFDVVVAFDVIEHLKNREVFLSEIRRVLVEGGLLLLSAPNSETTFKKLKKATGLRYYSDPTHVIEYTQSELEDECLRGGFACESVAPVVLDTPFYGLFDFIGGISLPIYERLDRYKRSAVLKRQQDTTGFRMILRRKEGM